jgi:hypothetical protein
VEVRNGIKRGIWKGSRVENLETKQNKKRKEKQEG